MNKFLRHVDCGNHFKMIILNAGNVETGFVMPIIHFRRTKPGTLNMACWHIQSLPRSLVVCSGLKISITFKAALLQTPCSLRYVTSIALQLPINRLAVRSNVPLTSVWTMASAFVGYSPYVIQQAPDGGKLGSEFNFRHIAFRNVPPCSLVGVDFQRKLLPPSSG
jgi:hypothetical protein